MTERQIRFNPEYLDEQGKWISLKPENMDLLPNKDFNFFVQIVDKETEIPHTEKISLRLNAKCEKQ